MPDGPNAAPDGAAPRPETPGEGETRTRGEAVAPYSVGVVRNDEIFKIRAYEEADKQLRELLRGNFLLLLRKVAVRTAYPYFRQKLATRAEKLMRANNNPWGEYNLVKSTALHLFSKGEAVNADKNREEFEKAQQAGVQTAEFLGSTGEKYAGQTGIEITGPLKDKFEKAILLKIAKGEIKDEAEAQKAILDFVKDKDNIGEENIEDVFGVSASEFGKAADSFASNCFEAGQAMGKDMADGKFNEAEMGNFVKLYFGNIKEGSDTKVKTKVDGVLKRLQSLHLGPLAIGGALANPAVIGAAGALTGFLGARGLGNTVGVATAAIPIAGLLSGAGFAAWRAGGEAKEDVAMYARTTSHSEEPEVDEKRVQKLMSNGMTEEQAKIRERQESAKRNEGLEKIVAKLGRAKSSELINGGGEELLLSGQPRLSIEELKKLPISAAKAGEAIEDIPRNRDVLKRRRSEIEARLNFGDRNRVDFITYDNITSFKAERFALMKASLEIKKLLQDAGDTDIDKFLVASEDKLKGNKTEADKAQDDYIKARRIRAALVGGAVGFGAGILIHAGISLDEATGRHVAGAIEQVGGTIQHAREQLQDIMSGNKSALPEIPIAGTMASELATSGGGGKMASIIHETTPTNEPAPLAGNQPEVLQTNIQNEIKPVNGPNGEWSNNAIEIDERIWEKGNDQFLHTLKKGDAIGLDITRMHEEVQKLVQKGDIGFAFTTADGQTIFVPESSDAVKDGILWLDPNNNKDLVTMQNGNKIPISELRKMIVNGEALAKLKDGDIATELNNHREVFNVKFIEAAQMVRDGNKNILHALATIQGTGTLPDTVEVPLQQQVPQTGIEIPKPTTPGGPEAPKPGAPGTTETPKPTQTPGAIPSATETPKPTGTPPTRTEAPTTSPTAEVKPALSPTPTETPLPSPSPSATETLRPIAQPTASAAPGESPRPGLGEIFLSSEPLVPVVGTPRELPEKMRERVEPTPPPPAPPPQPTTPAPVPAPTGGTEAAAVSGAPVAEPTPAERTSEAGVTETRVETLVQTASEISVGTKLIREDTGEEFRVIALDFEVGKGMHNVLLEDSKGDITEIQRTDLDQELAKPDSGFSIVPVAEPRILTPETAPQPERIEVPAESTTTEAGAAPEAPTTSAETILSTVSKEYGRLRDEAREAVGRGETDIYRQKLMEAGQLVAELDGMVHGVGVDSSKLSDSDLASILEDSLKAKDYIVEGNLWGLSTIFEDRGQEPGEPDKLEKIIERAYSKATAPEGTEVKIMITQAEEQSLRDRGFSQEDINKMAPDEAAAILAEPTQILRADTPLGAFILNDSAKKTLRSLGWNEDDIRESNADMAARIIASEYPKYSPNPPPSWEEILGKKQGETEAPTGAAPIEAPEAVQPPIETPIAEAPAPEPVVAEDPLEKIINMPSWEVQRIGKEKFGEDWNGSITALRSLLVREALTKPTMYERDMWGDKAEEMIRIRNLSDQQVREEADKIFGPLPNETVAHKRFLLEQRVAPVIKRAESAPVEPAPPEAPVANKESPPTTAAGVLITLGFTQNEIDRMNRKVKRNLEKAGADDALIKFILKLPETPTKTGPLTAEEKALRKLGFAQDAINKMFENKGKLEDELLKQAEIIAEKLMGEGLTREQALDRIRKGKR